MVDSFVKKIQQFICRQQLMDKQGRYLVALSGGADSVALLMTLRELGYQVEAVHCNFHLRGAESDRDESFCVDLCEKHGVALHRVHFDTRTYADLHHVSIEMAARELRYGHFEQLRRDAGFDAVCVAHHCDDSVETILLNIIRGTGVHGLTGIAAKKGYVVRPLLCVSRDEIECFLRQRAQEFVTDSSNLVNDVKRNKIRLDILPQLKELNPSFGESLLRMARHLQGAERILDEAARKYQEVLKNDGSIEHQLILDSPSPEYLIYQLFASYGFSSVQIAEMTDGGKPHTGSLWRSNTHELLFDRGRWYVQPLEIKAQKTLKIPEEGTYIYNNKLKIRIERKQVDEYFSIPKDKFCIALDNRDIHFPLTLRLYAEGDRFVPFGMKGSKLVSDYLTDNKKTLFEKRQQLVLVNSNNDMLWLVGERTDNRYRVTTETTKVLVVSVGC